MTSAFLSARAERLAFYTLPSRFWQLASGALLFDGETVTKEPAPEVEVVDTVAAGDAFVAALVVAHKGCELRLCDALKVAVAAGSLATTIDGAIPSLPRREDVPGL